MLALNFILRCRNATKEEDISFFHALARGTLQLPRDLIHQKWKEVMNSQFQHPININISDGSSSPLWLQCLNAVNALSISQETVLSAFTNLFFNYEAVLPFGDLMVANAFQPTVSFSTEKTPMQQDYEAILTKLVDGGPYRSVYDALRFVTNDTVSLLIPQPMIANQELYRGNANVNLSEFASSYPLVLRVMKYARQPVSEQVVELGDLNDVHKGMDALDLPLRGEPTSANPRTSPRILQCKFGHALKSGKECASLFERSYSTQGLVYTFNAHNFWRLYTKTKATKTFYREINQKKRIDELKAAKTSPSKIVSYGASSAFEAYLAQPLIGAPMALHDRFLFVLHDPSEIPDMESQAVLLLPGALYTFVVSPKQVITSSDVKDIKKTSRNCLFSWESDKLKLFKNYTQAGCEFECKLEKAHEACGCTPWDYPHLEEPISMCNKEGEACFKSNFSVSSTVCDCPGSCSYTDYTYNYHEEPLKMTPGFCSSGIIPRKHFTYYLLTGQTVDKRNWYSICDAFLHNRVTVVRVYAASGSIGRTIRNKRVSLAGQVSQIGLYKSYHY